MTTKDEVCGKIIADPKSDLEAGLEEFGKTFRRLALQEAALRFRKVKQCEDKLCSHPKMCLKSVADALDRMAEEDEPVA